MTNKSKCGAGAPARVKPTSRKSMKFPFEAVAGRALPPNRQLLAGAGARATLEQETDL